MIPLRLAREVTYQLERAGEHERLASVFANIPVFLRLYRSEARSDLLSSIRTVHEHGTDIEELYRTRLAALKALNPRAWADAVPDVSLLFDDRANWTFSQQLTVELLSWATAHGSPRQLQNAHLRMGITHWRIGQNDEALAEYSISLDLARQNGDKAGVSATESNIGMLLWNQGEYRRAMECFREQLKVKEELNDRLGVSRTYSRMGHIHVLLGEHDKAIECYNQSLAISRSCNDRLEEAFARGNIGAALVFVGQYDEALPYLERQYEIASGLGARETMSKALFNAGTVYYRKGDHARAMSAFEQHLNMARVIGDRRAEALALGNIGDIYFEKGQYARAAQFFRDKLAISQPLGDKRGIALAQADLGRIHLRLGEYEEAFALLQEGEKGHRAIESHELVTEWLCEIGAIYLEVLHLNDCPNWLNQHLADLNETSVSWRDAVLHAARTVAEEALAIGNTNSNPAKRFTATLILARTQAAQGEATLALNTLETMLQHEGDDERIASLHYWLWKLRGAEEEVHQIAALTGYEALYSRIPKFELRKRIAELKGEPIPMSADEVN
ncbi:MAG: tetratricopeptide repeat protein [Bacteroidota bacterium]|nr:tetratricopeptide repeat protein [Bacteroidota bacterium]MDP4233804.1 tetratricopeptide repeat protein [Bacteroidota bacterium]MDP4242443.1 tetratricopeptide repeat protein [Bacteroidota bacterium]MDP4287565.1 tetratricopeptide repeat protein [Bacteroidota bacterium]